MSRINLPINQVRLTNVAIVRMTKGGKRFEIACYRNKVVNYRQGIETDLSEVLQTERVFTNVSKGEFAKSQDLQTIFGTTDEHTIIQLILTRGDLQIGDLERTQQYESMARDIATWITENCIHPVTQRPYTIPQIRQAMKAAEYTIHPTRPMKRQYLDCFKKIQSALSIIRAPMELQLTYPQNRSADVQRVCQEHALLLHVKDDNETTNDDDGTNSNSSGSQRMITATLLVDPSMYRVLEDLAKSINDPPARLEILKQVVMREGDSNLEDEVRGTKLQALQQHDNSQPADAPADLTKQLVSMSLTGGEGGGGHNNNYEEEHTVPNRDSDDEYATSMSSKSRQNQKQAQKKSKKAMRREKEELEDRQARLAAEERRRAERADLVGDPRTRTKTTAESSTDSSRTDTGGNGMTTNNTATTESKKACNTCGGSFTPTEYRAHFRSDWHRYNIKLKMKNVMPVSEEEFRLCDADAFFDV